MRQLAVGPEDDTLPAHSPLGASGAHRWLHCPGSFHLSRKLPAKPSSIYAATGTLAHQFIQDALSEGHTGTMIADETVGANHQVDQHVITVDQTLVDGVNMMLEYVYSCWDDYEFISIERTVMLDSYFKAAGIRPPVRLYGRTDVAMIQRRAPGLVEIIDYKNGAGILVDPKDNPQMFYYAAGMLADLKRRGFEPHHVKLTVVQPNAKSGDKIKSTTVDTLDVLMWVDDVLIPGVIACTDQSAPLVPEVSICRFCPVSVSCPALIDRANEMAKRDFADALLPADMNDLSEQLKTAELAELRISALRAYAVEQLKSQVLIPGWGLVPTDPRRRWKDEDKLLAALASFGLKHAETHTDEMLSPAQMEKLVRRKKLNWKSFEPFTERVSGGVKLGRTDRNAATADFPEED